jgi:two-component sensor histidine kinase
VSQFGNFRSRLNINATDNLSLTAKSRILAEKTYTDFRPPDIRRRGKYIVELSSIAIIYVALAKLSLALASIHPSATPVWPPTGFALGIVLLLGYPITPAIFVGAFLANVTTAGSISTSLAIATGNALEGLVGAYLINRWSDGCSTFDTPGGVIKFALICVIPSTVISATLGVGSLSLAGYADWSNFRSIWTTWWMGDLAGALVITPAIVLWGTDSPRWVERRELFQAGSIYMATIAVGLVAFSPLLEQSPSRSSLAFLAILPLMWAALRRTQRDTATIALLLSCFAVWGTLSNAGPFVRSSLNESFLLLLAFMISVCVPSLALSAEVAVRRRHQEHVNSVMHELSHRSKNLLSVVQSMANQVARQTKSFDDFYAGFSRRLCAFSETHDLLVESDWHGVDIRELIRTQLAPFHISGDDSVLIEGPRLKLNPKAAEQIGLAVHELGTNAARHGALSGPTGIVKIRWEQDAGRPNPLLRIIWKEMGGPPVERTERRGFGDVVLTRLVPASLQGTASLEFEPEGVKWELQVPSRRLLA